MVYPVSCTAVCYVTVITLFIKELGWSVQIWGYPDPPVVAPLLFKFYTAILRWCVFYSGCVCVFKGTFTNNPFSGVLLVVMIFLLFFTSFR